MVAESLAVAKDAVSEETALASSSSYFFSSAAAEIAITVQAVAAAANSIHLFCRGTSVPLFFLIHFYTGMLECFLLRISSGAIWDNRIKSL